MKIFAVIISDYDLFGIEGLFTKKSSAIALKKKLKKDKDYIWKKYLKLVEYEVSEE